jgi:hypothetical protein
MSAQERRVRSRLVQLLSSCALLRGTLSLRERTCGKAGCRCARGHRHAGLYLVWSEQGRLRQRFVPREREAQVRAWVAQYQEVRRLLEALVQMQLDQLTRKDEDGGA